MSTSVLRRGTVASLVGLGVLMGCGSSAKSTAPTTFATLPATTTTRPRPTTTVPKPKSYIVQRHDTLRRIAARFHVTVEAIVAANPAIKDPNKIDIGQRIVIPVATPTTVARLRPTTPPTTAKKK